MSRPGGGRPPGRIGRGGIGPPAGRYPGGRNRSGGVKGGGAGRPPSGGAGGGSKKSACDMWIPVAVAATLFYALPRMAWDGWRARMAKGRPGNQRPRSGRGPSYRRPGGGGGGGGYTSKGPKGGMSAGVVGPVRGLVYTVAALAIALVGTPVAVIIHHITTGGTP